ncbi:MAG: DUF1273 domain-containing protein [Clostridiales bacterium]|jgi:uncharacterized phage-like protein YoqJ|nr:DUF1273 domain-containing protein [Clostridiales bacterium]
MQQSDQNGVRPPYVNPNTVCCFTGNRPQSLPWGADETDPRCLAVKANLRALTAQLIGTGYAHFICGGATGGDMYFAEAVLSLKHQYPPIRLECALPCPGHDRMWDRESRLRLKDILSRCDYVTNVSGVYFDGCMQARNRYMLSVSSALIHLCYTSVGGAASTIKAAKKRGLILWDAALTRFGKT